MNKNYTLKELADMFASVHREALSNGQSIAGARELALKHILDAIGYEFPKDAEREAFDAWWKANRIAFCNEEHAFQLWKAGREELRQAINKPSYSTPEQIDESIQNLTTKEPAWIPWGGGDKSPIPGKQTKFEVEFRGGVRRILNQSTLLCWQHHDTAVDIIAYRILD